MTQRQTRANQIKQPNRKHTEQNTKSQKNNGNKQKQQRQTHIYIFFKKNIKRNKQRGEPSNHKHTRIKINRTQLKMPWISGALFLYTPQSSVAHFDETKNATEFWGAAFLRAPELRNTLFMLKMPRALGNCM